MSHCFAFLYAPILVTLCFSLIFLWPSFSCLFVALCVFFSLVSVYHCCHFVSLFSFMILCQSCILIRLCLVLIIFWSVCNTVLVVLRHCVILCAPLYLIYVSFNFFNFLAVASQFKSHVLSKPTIASLLGLFCDKCFSFLV